MTGRWRVGRKVGKTIYVHSDDDPDGDGELVGVMFTRELAALVVEAVEFYQAHHDEGAADEPPTRRLTRDDMLTTGELAEVIRLGQELYGKAAPEGTTSP